MPRPMLIPTLIGLDLDATRARAVRGPAGQVPQELPLAPDEPDLPLALNLEGRRPQVGRAGRALCRQAPHLICENFLAALGTNSQWLHGRHRLDADKALGLVFSYLSDYCRGGIGLTLPGYVSGRQAVQVQQAARKARLALLGTASAPLAAALAGHEQHPWLGLAVVVDADDHALTFTAVMADEEQAQVLRTQSLPRLGIRTWKQRVLDGVAERCVRSSRRDPRDSAPAEQSLFDQLDGAFEHGRAGRAVELTVRAASWFQTLVVPPEELTTYCARPLRHLLNEIQRFVAETAFQTPRRLVLTQAAARLPGLVQLLHGWLEDLTPPGPADGEPEDFGEDLLPDSPEPAALLELPGDALALQAHQLAALFHQGRLPREHLELAAPLRRPVPLDVGPARLTFLDREYPLAGGPFVLGRQPGCDLVFDSALYPSVSARHCEILPDARGGFILRDRSRNGTLVNDRFISQQTPLRPGDWIRLGIGGPLLRFLGQAGDSRKLTTTA